MKETPGPLREQKLRRLLFIGLIQKSEISFKEMLSRLRPLLLAALMGKAGKDGQLGVHPVVLQVLLQALHAGHAVVAVRRIADELGVVFAVVTKKQITKEQKDENTDNDQNGTFWTAARSTSCPK